MISTRIFPACPILEITFLNTVVFSNTFYANVSGVRSPSAMLTENFG